MHYSLFKFKYFNPFCFQIKLNSSILGIELEHELNNLCEFSRDTKWGLKYKATRDGQFVYSLVNQNNKPFKLKCDDVYLGFSQNRGPSFGRVFDIHIHIETDSNLNQKSNYFFGAQSEIERFTTVEIEVFSKKL